MIRINLLPRDERQVKRTFTLPKVGAVMPLLVLILVAALFAAFSVVQAMQVSRLQADIAKAEQEAEKLRPAIQTINELTQKRQELERRLGVITGLDKQRLTRVKLVDEVSKCVPEHLWMTQFEEIPGSNRVQVEGVTFSNLLVADFMSRLEESPLYGDVDLVVAEKGTIDQRNVVKFKVTASMTL
ncbi:MAG TPA: PilN domain-containing protein [Candidatus Eisenbacteria bacterium]|jgi:type IV pilus assembly protein PilN|nr:PilN domain-containing protein [Candidatus Eisenbacteria bacterium]HEU4333353.1 PilN domain-containing protein [Candidatus Eisenbacteria bacterium]